MPTSVPPTQPSLRLAFADFDRDGDDKITDGEVDAYLDDIGVPTGFIRSASHNAFNSRFDTRTADGIIEWDEFVDNAHELMPKALQVNGRVDPTKVDSVFDAMAGPGAAVADRAQLEAFARIVW